MRTLTRASLRLFVLLAGMCGAGSTALGGQRRGSITTIPIARVEDTEDASMVRAEVGQPVYDESRNLFGNPGDPDMNRRADEHQHHRRSARLELVHQPHRRSDR